MVENIERDEVIAVEQTEDNFLTRTGPVNTNFEPPEGTPEWDRLHPYESGILKKSEKVVEENTSILITLDRKLTQEAADLIRMDFDNPCKDDKFMGVTRFGQQQYFGCYVPEMYIITMSGIWKMIQRYDRVRDEVVDAPELVTSTRFMPTGEFTNSDGVNFIELTFVNSKLKLEQLRVPLTATLSSKRWDAEIRKNNYSSLDITDNELKQVIDFIKVARAANLNVGGTAYKEGEVFTQTGWADKECTKFVLGNKMITTEHDKIITKDVIFIDVKGTEITEKMKSCGSLEKWVGAINQIIDVDRLRFKMYYDVGSITLAYLGVPNSAYGIVGDSSIGKTFTMQCGISMFGNPHAITGHIINGDISLPTLNAYLTTCHDIPTPIDEVTVMRDEVKKALTYAIGNGKESGRSKTDGVIRSTGIIRTNVTLTGETEVTHERNNNGANARAFVTKEAPIPIMNSTIIEKIRADLCENYGHIGELLIHEFLANRDMLKQWYYEAIDRIRETATDNIMSRKVTYFANAEVAGKLLELVFKKIGVSSKDPQTIIDSMWSECVLGHPDTPTDIKMFRQIMEFAKEKPANFLHGDSVIPANRRADDIYGFWGYEKNSNWQGNKPKNIDITPAIVHKILIALKWTEAQITAAEEKWRYRGLTTCSPGNAEVKNADGKVIKKQTGKLMPDGTYKQPYFIAHHVYQPGSKETTKGKYHRFTLSNVEQYLEYDTTDESIIQKDASDIIKSVFGDNSNNQSDCTFDSPY